MEEKVRNILFLLVILCIVGYPTNVNGEVHKINDLYKTLDSLIAKRVEINGEKENRIQVIREELFRHDTSDDEVYHLNLRLYDEYLAFRFDSAYKYIVRNIEIQHRNGNVSREYACELRLSHILSVAGLFDKARQLLQGIDKNMLDRESLSQYYNAWQEYYLFLSEQAEFTVYFHEYQDSAMVYRKLLKSVQSGNSYTKVFNYATYICEQGKVDKAISLLENYLPHEQNNRRYSILTSTLAYFYWKKKNVNRREEYLLLSAINDERCAIRETNSLRELSILLMDKGETDHALQYLNASIEDATYYGTRLRNLQAAHFTPQITRAYSLERTHSQYITIALLISISLVALVLIISRMYRSRLIHRLEEANRENREINEQLQQTVEQLNDTNGQLNAANNMMRFSGRIKDEYLGRFYELGSSFISKADEQNKKLNRLARERKMEELYKELKSSHFLSELTDSFYLQFDEAVLSIFPDFVSEVNSLLEEEYKFMPQGDKLTTELRILALIRLGITENQKIASILRSSITTVYTYRSKMKAKAKRKESFENDVKILGI